ncbi:MAG: hypothetical protein Q8L81_05305 [Bacteroidota bacterium]|nr:hypothetical protein [Bacteroidota bacterium]
MRAIFLLLVLSLFVMRSPAQTWRVNSLIKKLNNNQFTIVHEEKPGFTMNGRPAYKLIKIGKPATEKLIAALSDTTKTIMAHLVLCHIYFKVATFAGPKVITVNDKHVSNYFLGQEKGEGLIISETKTNDAYKLYITAENLTTTINFWKNKTIKK